MTATHSDSSPALQSAASVQRPELDGALPHVLAPRPMTADEIRSLVERVRAADDLQRAEVRSRLNVGRPREPNCRCRQAVRYAHDHRVPLIDASRAFKLSVSTLWSYWQQEFPNDRPVDGRRRRR